MSGERAQTLPEALSRWLDGHAAERGVDRDDLLVRAVLAYRLVEEEGEILEVVSVDEFRVRDCPVVDE